MQKDSKYTKWKIIGGYSLLFFFTVLTSIPIYRQITRLIVNEANDSNANQKLFIIGNTITGLYEAEALSNAFIQTGSRTYFRKYKSIMEATEANIDSLRDWTTRLDQQLRIDTISNLLEEKVRNLQDLVRVKSSYSPDEFYSKAIASIESGRDTTPEEVNIRRRFVTTVDSSYTKPEKKKKRWLFFRPKQDSVLQVSTSHHIIIDTLDTSLRNTDTVVNILRSTWEDVQKQNEDITRRINQKEYALIRQSTEITDQLKRILGDYEKEEIFHTQHKQQTREQAVTTMIRIFAWVAVITFMLVVFLTFFILRDLSRSQRYRRELENANQYADQLLKSRERMILTVTHDIKSPLSSVIGYIDLLTHTDISERQRYYLKNMQGSSEHILKLVGNLLDLSKLENNKMTAEEITFNPSGLFREISDNFVPLAAAKHLELKSKFGKDLDGNYKGDALRIRQIITNILSNAVKYTNQGSIHFTAHISTDNKRIIIRIKDTGPGMTTDEQKIIFQEFTRLSSHSAIEGTGLGLTITLKLIQLLGGEIQLQSEPGQGSCFTIFLPLCKDTSVQPALPAVPPSLSGQPAPDGSPTDLRILLVDDDILQLEMTSGLLERNGIHPTITTRPEEVVARLQEHPFDLVFSDIQMPGMNGFELVRQIRQAPDPKVNSIPVVALSADSDKQEKEYLQSGFTAYLAKPFSSVQFIQLISSLTGREYSGKPQRNALPTPATPPAGKQEYTLHHILQFTDNDPKALENILDSFTVSTQGHIQLLKEYLAENKWDAISQLAHKMLPLFRQLEACEIVPPLEKLEHPGASGIKQEEIKTLAEEIIRKAQSLIDHLSTRGANGQSIE